MRSWLVSLAFAAFLLAPSLAGLAGLRAEAIENRRLAERPSWSLSSWVDADAYEALTAWLKDALPLRAQAVALDSWLDYAVLGDSPSPRVLIGAGGELFLDTELRSACAPDAVFDREALARVGRRLARRGTELYVLLSPNKSFLYPERLPAPGARWERCGAAARAALRADFAQPLPFTPVLLWDAFAAEQQRGRRIFPKRGRHWEPIGAILQAKALVEALAPGLWNEDAVVPSGEEAHPAELPSRFMNLAIEERWEGFRVERPGVAVRAAEFALSPRSQRPSRRTTATSSGPPLVPGRTLFFHDSFLESTVLPFAAYAEHAEFVHWTQLFQYPEDGAKLLARADRLVLQVVEDRAGVELGRRVSGIVYVTGQLAPGLR